jgi:hypothetical protein
VPRRIEIELTSARPDGTWTWRAAGAREPKGVLDGKLLYEGAKAGDVLRAEADFELEGISVISVIPPKAESRPQPERIEIVGPGRPDGPGVTTQLVGRGERRGGRRGDDDRRERGPGRPGDSRGRTEGGRPRREGGPDRAGGDRARADRTGGERDGRPRREGAPDRGGRPEGGRRGPAREGGQRDGDRRSREGAGTRPARSESERRGGSPAHTSSQADRSRTPRLNPGTAHRRAVMDDLPPEQRPIAEQLQRGGIPAVRTALHLEREKAEAEGRPAPNTEALLAIAEGLLPRLRAAEWRDRAEAAVAAGDDVSMRDLRSIVAGADLARDDESRALAATLREAVEARVAKLHSDWVSDITAQLDAGRAVRAVRLSSRPPDASARLDSDLATRLADAAGATMAPGTAPDLWVSMLEAVAESPIRRSVTPAGLPPDAPAELKRAAHQYSGSIPALARMLGVTIPPPPSAARRRSGDRPAGDRPGGSRPPRTKPGDGADAPTHAEAASETGGPDEPAATLTGPEEPTGETPPTGEPAAVAEEPAPAADEAPTGPPEAGAEADADTQAGGDDA